MIVVKISGGLGNQIYQYALYRKFKYLGVEAKMSLCYFRDNEVMQSVPNHSSKYLLDDIFSGIIEEFSTEQEDDKFRRFSSNSILRFLARKRLIPGLIIEDIQCEKSTYHPNVFKYKNTFLDGYWQSNKYFNDIIDLLREELVFKKPLMAKNKEIAEIIKSSESVSVHIRRGDYVNTEYELLGIDYYKKALDIVKAKRSNPTFFIFSDDIDWCKNNLSIEGTYINWNTGSDSYIDMQLMSLCKSNIVANSTFSIWAAMLNSNVDQLVIHPFKYSKYATQKADRWPDDWIKVVY